MNKPDHNLDDIFPEKELPPKPGSLNNPPEHITNDLRKRRHLNISYGIVISSLLVLIIGTVIRTYLAELPSAAEDGVTNTRYIPTHTLSPKDLWVLNYRKTIRSLPGHKKQLNGPQTTQGIKHTAYQIIMGEQALRTGQLELAETHLKQALKTIPDLHGIHGLLGLVYLKQADFQDAAEHLQQATEEGVSIELLNNLGLAYLGLQDYERAEQALKQALQMDPGARECRKNLASLYYQTGRAEDALRQFEAFIEFHPEDHYALETYVGLLLAAGRAEDAVAFLKKSAEVGTLPVYLLLARTAAQSQDAYTALSALKNVLRFLSPAETLEEMHREVFEDIRNERGFEDLAFQLELAAISLSTNIPALNLD